MPVEPKRSGQLLYDFRTITPANINPNNRTLGYNWDITESNPNPLVRQKAQNTISEIEARADVDVTKDNIDVKEIQDYTFKVKMTPAVANWVKEYNGKVEYEGSYNNKTMECYDYTLNNFDEKTCKDAGYTWDGKSCKMTNIFCYSTFIDELVEKFADEVDEKNRPRKDARAAAESNFETYKNLNSLSGNTTPIVANDYWTIYIYSNLDVNGDGIPDVGPSWK